MIEITIPRYSFAAHFVYYVPRRSDETIISRQIINTKEGRRPNIESWFAEEISKNLKKKEINIDYVVRALGSTELVPSRDAPLDRIGFLLAKETGASFMPQILSKVRATTPMHKISNATDRHENIKGAYQAQYLGNKDSGTILVIDDVITTNNTAVEIARALSEMYPNFNLVFFAIAKTNEDPKCNCQFMN